MKTKDAKTLVECENIAFEWWERNIDSYKAHAENVARPLSGLEPIFWQDRMLILADAYAYAKSHEPFMREVEQQSIALLTEAGYTVARAEVEARRVHKAVKMLRQLAESADRKLSCLQSLNKQRG